METGVYTPEKVSMADFLKTGISRSSVILETVWQNIPALTGSTARYARLDKSEINGFIRRVSRQITRKGRLPLSSDQIRDSILVAMRLRELISRDDVINLASVIITDAEVPAFDQNVGNDVIKINIDVDPSIWKPCGCVPHRDISINRWDEKSFQDNIARFDRDDMDRYGLMSVLKNIENDVNIIMREAKRLDLRPEKYLIVSLTDLDENTKIKALQERFWIWNEQELKTLSTLFDKPYIVR